MAAKHITKKILFCGFWQSHHKLALKQHLDKFSYDRVGLVSHDNYLEQHDAVFISQREISYFKMDDFNCNLEAKETISRFTNLITSSG